MPAIRLKYHSSSTALDDLVLLFKAMHLPLKALEGEKNYDTHFESKLESYLRYWVIAQIMQRMPPKAIMQFSKEEFIGGLSLNIKEQTLAERLRKTGQASGLIAFTLYNQVRALEAYLSEKPAEKARKNNKPGVQSVKEILVKQYHDYDGTYDHRLFNEAWKKFKPVSHLWAGYVWMKDFDGKSTEYLSGSLDDAAQDMLLRILAGSKLVLDSLSSFIPHGQSEQSLVLKEVTWVTKRVQKELKHFSNDKLPLDQNFIQKRMIELKKTRKIKQ